MYWISVKDRLPEYYENVLLHFNGDSPEDCEYLVGHREKHHKEGEVWVKYDYLSGQAPYCDIKSCLWMPLPEPPKKM